MLKDSEGILTSEQLEELKQQQEQVKAELAALEVQVENTDRLVKLAEQDLELQQTELAGRRIQATGENRMVFDAIVVGGGIVGCTSAYYLARKGLNVTH